ncbi:MAG: hypothetical protein QNJ35_08075 [Paracoccaceae bacterium]|nr:hypothetical protein [Paracoccaceae bacterium]
MIILAFLILGIAMGIRAAKRRNGTRLDMAQYAAGYGIAFIILGGLITILLERLVT